MEKLSFRVSSGLKNIIGRELITDKIIAIFEIVKNSYDAGATRVDISFDNISSDKATISISDNGCGMNKRDLIDKWLFVAYSEKRKIRNTRYIETLNNKRTYAGAKGVGRFSCDRLGSYLDLYSKKTNDPKVNMLSVNWDDFESDSKNEFANITVEHNYVEELPSKFTQGTSVVIHNLRETWNRNDILDLKKALIRLINPYETSEDVFEIFLHCDEEISNDKEQQFDKNRINCRVKNYVFETLNLKTTQISVSISSDGQEITTQLNDRGVFLFKIIQKCNYNYLNNILIELFYLNRAAKINFNKLMDVSCAAFGSIFVYKNGFRIMPYGEPGADIFGIDRRKAQGYNRFLGTRDVMGRVIVLGDNPDFVETSSRDGGFIHTKSYNELEDFYKNYVHVPLEKYVVNLINWGDESKDGKPEINPEDIKYDIIKYITDYEKKGHLISLEVNDDLFKIVNEKSSNKTSDSINEIKILTQKYNNPELDRLVDKISKQNKHFLKEQKMLTNQIDSIEKELESKKAELNSTKNQVMFLKNLSDPKFENATESLHLMNTYGKSIKVNINKLSKEINTSSNLDLIKRTQKYIYEIIKATQKINGTYTLAISANYDIKKQTQIVHLYDFMSQYITNAMFSKTGEFLKVKFSAGNNNYKVKINPLEFSMIIENIIYNSYKANAKKLEISISDDNEYVSIIFKDDGDGLSKQVSDPSRIFELGYTTTDGTGVGLSFAKKTIEKWNGTIEYIENDKPKGFTLRVKLKNEH